MLTREQVKMARAALGWTAQELADKAGLAVNTVRRFENGADAYGETLAKMQRTLEAAGLQFIDEDGGGPGVRFRERRRS